jgi:transcriptional regulator with XRE-family HTH domain
MTLEVGTRIRRIRSQQGRTLQEVADLCGCSKGLLSKIENGKVVPAVATLAKIAKALGVRVSVLMEDGETTEAIFTPDMRDRFNAFVPTSKGYTICALAPHFTNKKMQPVLFRSSKGEVKPHSVSHEGEEFIYVLEGEVKIHVGQVEYHLKPGESVYFKTINEHGVIPVTDCALYLDIFVE